MNHQIFNKFCVQSCTIQTAVECTDDWGDSVSEALANNVIDNNCQRLCDELTFPITGYLPVFDNLVFKQAQDAGKQFAKKLVNDRPDICRNVFGERVKIQTQPQTDKVDLPVATGCNTQQFSQIILPLALVASAVLIIGGYMNPTTWYWSATATVALVGFYLAEQSASSATFPDFFDITI